MHDTSPASWDTQTIYSYDWPRFPIPTSNNIACGNYEWPFKLFIPGTLAETARGCSLCNVKYCLEAFAVRCDHGNSPRNFVPIRIIRTLPPSAFGFMDPLTVEGTWADKIHYTISINYQAIALGTSIPVDVNLKVLRETLHIKQVDCILRETHGMEGEVGQTQTKALMDRESGRWTLSIPKTEDGSRHCPHESQSSIRCKQNLPLFQILRRCSPDVDVHGISVSHDLYFEVEIEDEDSSQSQESNPGQWQMHPSTNSSQHSTSLPIKMFISPERPVDGWERFLNNTTKSSGQKSACFTRGVSIPPAYGKHVLDPQVVE